MLSQYSARTEILLLLNVAFVPFLSISLNFSQHMYYTSHKNNALSYHRVRGLCFLAVVFAETLVFVTYYLNSHKLDPLAVSSFFSQSTAYKTACESDDIVRILKNTAIKYYIVVQVQGIAILRSEMIDNLHIKTKM